MKVFPVRFTNEPVAMRRFLEALGLTTTIRSEGNDWIALEAQGGGIGLHSIAAAEEEHTTAADSLSFESEEPLEAVQTRLQAAGFESEIIDESFGRSLRVVDPDGFIIQVNEPMTDDYGYRRD